MVKFLTKKILILFSAIVLISFFGKIVLATPPLSFYEPGEEINPTCLPTDINCDVRPPLTSLNIDDTVYGASWDTDTTHAPSKNAVYDQIEALIVGGHNPVTLGTANGLSLATQVLSLSLASTSTTGALSDTDWNIFNNKQNALGFTAVPDTRTVNGHALSADVTVTASDVGLGNVTNESKATMFTSPTFTGTITGFTMGGNIALGANTLTTSNTGLVSNLNADLLDGQDGNYYATASGYVPYTGATTNVVLGANTLSTTAGIISPKFYPSADSTTAIQFNKADGTTNVVNIDTTNGRVGIGNTDADFPLTVIGMTKVRSSNEAFKSISFGVPASASYGSMQAWDANTGAMPLILNKDGGNVGIGTTAPSEKLTITSDAGKLKIENTSNPSAYYSTFEQNYNYSGPSFRILSVSGGVSKEVLGRYSENLSIMKDGGNVGIGTTTPSTKLHVESDLPIITLQRNDSASATGALSFKGNDGVTDWQIATNYAVGGAGLEINKGDASNTMLFIKNDGNVGIGTTAPDTSLHIYKNGNASEIIEGTNASWLNLRGGGTTTDWIVQNYADDTFRIAPGVGGNAFTIKGSTLNVGIGTTAPQGRLNVVMSGGVSGATANSDGNGLVVDSLTANTGISVLSADTLQSNYVLGSPSNALAGLIRWDNTANLMSVGTNNASAGLRLMSGVYSEAVRILSNGNVGIETTAPQRSLQVDGNGIAVTGTANAVSGLNAMHLGFGSNTGTIQAIQEGAAWRDLKIDGENVILQSINTSGKVGIGASPYFSLDIRTPSAVSDFVHIGQDATYGAFIRGAGNSTAGSAFIGNFLYNTTTPASSTSAGGTSTADGIYFDNGIHFLSNNSISGTFTPAERLTIKNDGKIGIGTVGSPVPGKLTVRSGVDTTIGSNPALWIDSPGAAGNLDQIAFGYESSTQPPAVIGAIQEVASGYTASGLFFATRATTGINDVAIERMRISKDGNVGIGTTAPGVKLHLSVDGSIPSTTLYPAADAFLASNNGNTAIRVLTAENTSATATPGITLIRSRGTLASPAVVQSGDTLGSIFGQGYDGVTRQAAATIKFEVDGGAGANDMPGRITFLTSPDGAGLSIPAERMRIDNGGNVGIGTTAPSYPLDIVTGTSFTNGGIRTKYALRFGSNTTTAPVLFPFNAAGYTIPDPTGKGLGFYSYSSTAGDIGIGFSGDNITATSSVNTNVIFSRTFAPTSGTGLYTNFNLTGIINQTGGANGITRGIYINPTLTSAADWRAIETTQGSLVMNDTYLAGSGSLAGSLLNLTQTWNTTGAPTAIKLTVTDTASSATSLLADLKVGASSMFSVSKAGVVQQAGCTTAGTLSADVSGNIICTPSSQDFKNNITDLTTGLSSILALRPVSYNFNSDMNMGSGVHFGFISEEVANVIPEFATYDNEGNPYGLDNGAILAASINAIKELNLNLEGIAGTITPLAGSENETFVIAFFNNIKTTISTWLADASNGIVNIFAGEIDTKSLCVSNESGEKTCITKEQLDALLINAVGADTGSTGTSPTPQPNPTPTPEPTPEPAPTPAPTPTPEPESTPAPTVPDTSSTDSVPPPSTAPAPEPTPAPESNPAPDPAPIIP